MPKKKQKKKCNMKMTYEKFRRQVSVKKLKLLQVMDVELKVIMGKEEKDRYLLFKKIE